MAAKLSRLLGLKGVKNRMELRTAVGSSSLPFRQVTAHVSGFRGGDGSVTALETKVIESDILSASPTPLEADVRSSFPGQATDLSYDVEIPESSVSYRGSG